MPEDSGGTQGCTVYKPISILAEGAAEIAVKWRRAGYGLNYTMSNGEYNVPCRIYKPILVTKENIDETVIGRLSRPNRYTGTSCRQLCKGRAEWRSA